MWEHGAASCMGRASSTSRISYSISFHSSASALQTRSSVQEDLWAWLVEIRRECPIPTGRFWRLPIFFWTNLRYILLIPLNWWIIFLKFWTSTGSSVTSGLVLLVHWFRSDRAAQSSHSEQRMDNGSKLFFLQCSLMAWSHQNFTSGSSYENRWGLCWEIDVGPPLFTLLQTEMLTNGANNG